MKPSLNLIYDFVFLEIINIKIFSFKKNHLGKVAFKSLNVENLIQISLYNTFVSLGEVSPDGSYHSWRENDERQKGGYKTDATRVLVTIIL